MTIPLLFIASGPRTWASARLRSYWIADSIPGAAAMSYSEFEKLTTAPDASAVVFQKYFSDTVAKYYKGKGAKVFWDACDPAWWWEPSGVRGIVPMLDGAVFCNSELAEDFGAWLGDFKGVSIIPDRLDLTHYTSQREHGDSVPVRFVWYGVAVNRIALFAALANMERLAANGHRIELTICDDQPGSDWRVTESFPIYHTEWKLDREVSIIASHDIALLPPYPGPWGRVKSNNKKLTAWACGLPVTTGTDYDELEGLVTLPDMRATLGRVGRQEVERSWTADKSAAQWMELIK